MIGLACDRLGLYCIALLATTIFVHGEISMY
jgi:hypothetical protein